MILNFYIISFIEFAILIILIKCLVSIDKKGNRHPLLISAWGILALMILWAIPAVNVAASTILLFFAIPEIINDDSLKFRFRK